MLQNAYFPAKIGAEIAENEEHFAEILAMGRSVAELAPTRSAHGVDAPPKETRTRDRGRPGAKFGRRLWG